MKYPMRRPEVIEFLGEIVEVCRKHGLSLSHEDSQGSFEVEYFDESYVNWLAEAIDNTRK